MQGDSQSESAHSSERPCHWVPPLHGLLVGKARHDHATGRAAVSAGREPAFISAGSARSTASSTKSVVRILVNRQNAVSVLMKVPFSASLFTGSPPPLTLKYSQLSRHIAIPAS